MAADERSDGDVQPVPDDPQSNPEQAVDAMEQRVFGTSRDASGGDDEPGDLKPAFEQDLEPEDQGSAEAGAEPSS